LGSEKDSDIIGLGSTTLCTVNFDCTDEKLSYLGDKISILIRSKAAGLRIEDDDTPTSPPLRQKRSRRKGRRVVRIDIVLRADILLENIAARISASAVHAGGGRIVLYDVIASGDDNDVIVIGDGDVIRRLKRHYVIVFLVTVRLYHSRGFIIVIITGRVVFFMAAGGPRRRIVLIGRPKRGRTVTIGRPGGRDVLIGRPGGRDVLIG